MKTFPLTPVPLNPQVMELKGVTDATIAQAEAKYGWLQKQSRRKIAVFETDEQGQIPQYLDRIGISHNVPDWGIGGTVTAIAGNVVTVSCSLVADGYDSIIFRNDDGSVSDIIAMTKTDDSTATVTGTLPAWVHVGTFISVGTSRNIVRDYIVTKVTARARNRYQVESVNYDDSVYN